MVYYKSVRPSSIQLAYQILNGQIMNGLSAIEIKWIYNPNNDSQQKGLFVLNVTVSFIIVSTFTKTPSKKKKNATKTKFILFVILKASGA